MLFRRSQPAIRECLLAVALLAVSWAAWAGGLVPAALRAAIIVRSAGYERGFSARSGGATLAVVVGKSGGSADDGIAMVRSLGKGSVIAGRSTRVVQITHESASATAGELRSQRAEIVYFAAGLEGLVKDIPAKEGDMPRILVCASGADVRVGCTLGVELADDKPRIVLNLAQANAAGLRFQPDFLRLARIVR
ncbi:MAG: YfiR family protein [Polyangiaceae bacterium]|nr:YfiR family protein [Polyangiaceae bacterium]